MAIDVFAIRAVPTEPATARRAIRSLFQRHGLVQTTDLAVTAPGGSWNLNVAAGEVWIDGAATGQGSYYLRSDATTVLALTPVGATTRTDLIVARIQDAFYSGAVNSGTIEVVQGTPGAGTPAQPSNTFLLATVVIPGSSSSVTSGMLTDERNTLTQGRVILRGGLEIAAGLSSLRSAATTPEGTIQVDTGTKRLYIVDNTATRNRIGHYTSAGRTGFIVRANVAQAIASGAGGVFTNATPDVEDYDSDSLVASGLFTVPAGLEGLWAFTFTAVATSGTITNSHMCRIVARGVDAFTNLPSSGAVASAMGLSVGPMAMTTGQTARAQIYQTTGVSQSFTHRFEGWYLGR